MKINCLIVDDEPLAADILENYISRIPDLVLAKKCSNAVEAFKELKKQSVQLIFLDIQMPQISGLEFLKSLSRAPAVIFTTAYSEHAVEGFNLDAVDYLLKPISFDRFLKAVNKAVHTISAKNSGASAEQLTGDDGEYIFVKSDKKIIKINLDDILYIEGLKDYVMIFTRDQRIITLQTMKNLEDKLPSSKFIRIHRSFIISLDKFKSIYGNTVEIKDKHLPIGKLYKEAFMTLVEKNSFIK